MSRALECANMKKHRMRMHSHGAYFDRELLLWTILLPAKSPSLEGYFQ